MKNIVVLLVFLFAVICGGCASQDPPGFPRMNETSPFQPDQKFFVLEEPQPLPGCAMSVFRAARGGMDGTPFVVIATNWFKAKKGDEVKLTEYFFKLNPSAQAQILVMPVEVE